MVNNSEFITAELRGPNSQVGAFGLGNQLFCAATTISTALDNNILPIFRYTQYQEPYKNNIFRKLNFSNTNYLTL